MRNPLLHAQFLNTLAYMELCGAQKISKSLRLLTAHTFLLEHASEEYRHAYYLRKLANKISQVPINQFDNKTIFCARMSRNYIYQFDRHIMLLLNKFGLRKTTNANFLAYILTTFAIEQRALPFYQLYESILREYELPISVKSIICEEDSHLSEMRVQITNERISEEILIEVLALERECFYVWLNAVTKEISDHDAMVGEP